MKTQGQGPYDLSDQYDAEETKDDYDLLFSQSINKISSR